MMTIILIVALILVVSAIWFLWPRDSRKDLIAPPKDMGGHVSEPHKQVHDQINRHDTEEPEPDDREASSEPPTPTPTTSHQALSGQVTSEADYSEEELMIRDVRALLHRGRKIEAVKRARDTGMGLREAKEFVENIKLPRGHGDDL